MRRELRRRASSQPGWRGSHRVPRSSRRRRTQARRNRKTRRDHCGGAPGARQISGESGEEAQGETMAGARGVALLGCLDAIGLDAVDPRTRCAREDEWRTVPFPCWLDDRPGRGRCFRDRRRGADTPRPACPASHGEGAPGRRAGQRGGRPTDARTTDEVGPGRGGRRRLARHRPAGRTKGGLRPMSRGLRPGAQLSLAQYRGARHAVGSPPCPRSWPPGHSRLRPSGDARSPTPNVPDSAGTTLRTPTLRGPTFVWDSWRRFVRGTSKPQRGLRAREHPTCRCTSAMTCWPTWCWPSSRAPAPRNVSASLPSSVRIRRFARGSTSWRRGCAIACWASCEWRRISKTARATRKSKSIPRRSCRHATVRRGDAGPGPRQPPPGCGR